MYAIKIAIIGFGKIAREEHLPAIRNNAAFEIAALVSRDSPPAALPCFSDIETLLTQGPAIDAVAICVPPHVRFEIAAAALNASKHVLLEKPPGATLGETEILKQMALAAHVTLNTSWHTRHAPAVSLARQALAGATVKRASLSWKEDIRLWHPGQQWIWQPGGLGVFDCGINGLAMATEILPIPFFLKKAQLFFPQNRQTPMTAKLSFVLANNTDFNVTFDWNHSGPDDKTMHLETDSQTVTIDKSGERLSINGDIICDAPQREYEAVYQHFAELIASAKSDVDVTPLAHVADAFMRGERLITDPFVG